MYKKSKFIAIVALSAMLFTTFPVQAQTGREIEGFEYSDGMYYKAGMKSELEGKFFVAKHNYTLKAGESFSIPYETNHFTPDLVYIGGLSCNISTDGIVTAVQPGRSEIYVSYNNNMIFTTITVDVYSDEYPVIDGYEWRNGTYYKDGMADTLMLDFYWTENQFCLEKGEYFSLPQYFNKNKKTQEKLSFTSSNPSVCAVTSDGMVQAKGTGEADITVAYGENMAVKPIKISVSAAKRSKTKQYESVVKEINKIYDKYGKAGSVTGRNFKTAYKEILATDRKLKQYSQRVEAYYGEDAKTKNKSYADYPDFSYVDVLEDSIENIMRASVHGENDNEYLLCSFGKSFVKNHLLCVDLWKLETVINNLSNYMDKLNVFDKTNADAFQIKAVKRNKKTGEVRVFLNKKVTTKQMYGSFLAPKYFTGNPLAWSSLLQANTELKSMPCRITFTDKNNKTYDYVGEYETGKDSFKLKVKDKYTQKLSAGTYTVMFRPITSEKYYSENYDTATYDKVAIIQNITIK